MNETKRIFIIAGEASGDMLGAGLLAELHKRYGKSLEIQGVGGEKMAEQGLESLFPMRDIALMGFAEILPHALRLTCRIKEACEAATNFRPDIVITIDSPGFNFRVVKWLKKCFGREVTCIHYVAPTVWAYKPERAAKTAALYDHLMVLLPFEARYFHAHGLKTTFVGHPVADELGKDYTPPKLYQRGKPLNLVLFPGSRKGEVNRLLPIFHETISILQRYYPKIHVSIPITRMMLPFLHTRHWKRPPALVLGKKAREQVMQEAHIALTKTGTVTLEIAKYGVPMVAAYKVNSLTARLVKRMLKIPYVNLVNIIRGREVIPEVLQDECTPERLCEELRRLIDSQDQCREQCHDALRALSVMRNAEHMPASEKAANVIASYLS